MQAQVVARRAGLVELCPHRRVLELQRDARVALRQRAARAAMNAGAFGNAPAAVAAVVEP